MELVLFISIISVSTMFFIFANIYNGYKIVRINKMLRESGLIIRSMPVIIMNNMVTDPNRPDIVSPSGSLPPPSYTESSSHHHPVPQGSVAPPPYTQHK